MRKINDLEELKQLSSKKICKCFIQLNFGLRSSKDIRFHQDTGLFTVFNHIDGTRQSLKEEELADNTNIIKALDNGALFRHS